MQILILMLPLRHILCQINDVWSWIVFYEVSVELHLIL